VSGGSRGSGRSYRIAADVVKHGGIMIVHSGEFGESLKQHFPELEFLVNSPGIDDRLRGLNRYVVRDHYVEELEERRRCKHCHKTR